MLGRKRRSSPAGAEERRHASPPLSGSDIRAQRDAVLTDTSLRGRPFTAAYAARCDAWLERLLTDGRDGVALVAVGGYGRSEMAPQSDLDVMLIHAGRTSDIKVVAEAVWYPLWDAGLKVGHGVRTMKEALALAASDLDTATALLDTRLVAGDPAPAQELARRAALQWQARAERFLPLMADALAARHARFDEVAFLLEPDLKEGRGGLRDVHAQRWAAATGRLALDAEGPATTRAYGVLLEARVALHRRTGRAGDRLTLQEQDGVAADCDYADADALMAAVSGAARTIAWTSDEAWDRITSALAGPTGRSSRADRQVGAGLVVRDRRLELTGDADAAADPTLVLRAAAAAAENGVRLSRRALDHLSGTYVGLPDPWPEEARYALVRLLDAGRAAIDVIESLDQCSLMVRTIPEWQAVRCKSQRNAYHRFTVDRHLCEAAAEAARLTDRVRRPDLLLVGALLHDIGKGFPGDHTDAGIEVVGRIAPRMGFDAQDVAVLVDMVRHHLLLPDVATRRDLADEATIAAVADAVSDHDRLDLLAALTEADSIATGMAAWGPWKAGLVAELVDRTDLVLGGEPPHSAPEPLPEGIDDLLRQARGGDPVVVEGAGPVVTVVAHDRPGLFAKVAGTLALHGLDVISARVWSLDEGLAVERFHAQAMRGTEADWPAVGRDLRLVLSGRLSLDARLADRARDYAAAPRPPAATPPRVEVFVDNAASEAATVVEVRAPDHLGTLYRITRALADMALDIRSAKVTTLGHEVFDAFYVVDGEGKKVTEAGHVGEIEVAVATHLTASA